ncbi:Hsp20/alpha crystallin family protein [Gloeocapsa sp. PCC 73106]|uniref:Hsp20/alpha crystallin family protein n=1 Tax=Gloeocapsa sp. PCC 73106 TaxID=102232 RepID=UPI0002FD8D4A|nr:Hsp20/alpha crystallin family protein [Gloeocapsa sp. PCC 73106]
MAIVHWNPENEMEVLRIQFDRIFQDITDWTTSASYSWQPPVELRDEGDKLVLRIQLPGWEAKHLDISVMREAVVIKGEYPELTEAEQKKIYYSEFRYPRFQRGIKLPAPVRNNQVEAEFTNGILSLHLPKVEEVINRVVKVNLDSTN